MFALKPPKFPHGPNEGKDARLVYDKTYICNYVRYVCDSDCVISVTVNSNLARQFDKDGGLVQA